jgi:hypothetical protein
MENPTNTKVNVPHLKNDAVVSLELGAGYIQYLQLALTVILKDKDTTGLGEKIKEKTKLEDWEQAAVAVTQLLGYVFETAEKQGMMVDKEIDIMSLL